jgi:hypothetical protein
MDRVFNKPRRISETHVRYGARIEGDECPPPPSHAARLAQYYMLRTLVDTPDLLNTGPVLFEKMTMVHNGTKWVVEIEALVEEASDAPH